MIIYASLSEIQIVINNKKFLYDNRIMIHGKDRIYIYILYGIYMFLYINILLFSIYLMSNLRDLFLLILYTIALLLYIGYFISITLMIFLSSDNVYISKDEVINIEKTLELKKPIFNVIVFLYTFIILYIICNILLIIRITKNNKDFAKFFDDAISCLHIFIFIIKLPANNDDFDIKTTNYYENNTWISLFYVILVLLLKTAYLFLLITFFVVFIGHIYPLYNTNKELYYKQEGYKIDSNYNVFKFNNGIEELIIV